MQKKTSNLDGDKYEQKKIALFHYYSIEFHIHLLYCFFSFFLYFSLQASMHNRNWIYIYIYFIYRHSLQYLIKLTWITTKCTLVTLVSNSATSSNAIDWLLPTHCFKSRWSFIGAPILYLYLYLYNSLIFLNDVYFQCPVLIVVVQLPLKFKLCIWHRRVRADAVSKIIKYIYTYIF